tara:strand:- start:231004 stop:231777 length:774 start_codon:yes stop_codon:yes gene_type:complete
MQSIPVVTVRLLCLVTCLIGACGVVNTRTLLAEDRVARSHDVELPRAGSDQDQVRHWIERLQSPRFRDRMEATARLRNLGVSAIDQLEDTCAQFDAEVSQRALEVLKQHVKGDDAMLRHRAVESLQRIADDSNHHRSSAARRFLQPMDEPKKAPTRGRMMIPVANPAFQIQIRNALQIKAGTTRRELSIEENGKKFRFVKDKNGLHVERPDGNGGVKKDSYKDAQELKEKDPEAERKFNQYFGKNEALQIQLGGRKN